LPTSSEVWSPEQRPVTGSVTVGVIANPASGRDIRRLVAGASVFDNVEKGNMVYRFMVGLGAVSVERVLMMPAASGLYDGLQRALHGHAFERRPLPELELVEMRLRHDARDTVEAVEKMRKQGVKAIAVLGGDGTNRVVASRCADTPICALSTGTNNAFPEMREATIAGLATGLVSTGLVTNGVLRREKILRVGLNGDPHHDCALVDVAVSSERFIGARALWKSSSVSELFVTRASPDALGFSAVAGLLDPIPRHARHGLHLRLTKPKDADLVINVPLAPGLIMPVGVVESRRIEPGRAISVEPGLGSIALDGEREIERGLEDRVEVSLATEGPLTIDVAEVMRLAARRGLLSDRAPLEETAAADSLRREPNFPLTSDR
jgi:predicted polyphosphate/ATP-dependent NAD kinase